MIDDDRFIVVNDIHLVIVIDVTETKDGKLSVTNHDLFAVPNHGHILIAHQTLTKEDRSNASHVAS